MTRGVTFHWLAAIVLVAFWSPLIFGEAQDTRPAATSEEPAAD